MISISSSANPQVRLWRSLLSSKGIKKEGLFIISGEKLFREICSSRVVKIVAEIINPELQPLTQAPHCYLLSHELFESLDESGTHFNLLVCETPEIKPWDSNQSTNGLEVFCPLGDPKNVGALLRSCEAFGAKKVVLLTESANPFLPVSIRASAGSCLRLPIEKGPSIKELQGDFFGLDLDGKNLNNFEWPKNARLLVGEEGQGLSQVPTQTKLQKLSIPTKGVESLNASIAVSIAMFHYQAQQSR